MATSSKPRMEAFEENQLSIKLTGDLQDVQITEEDLEDSGDDGDSSSSSGANALSTMSQDLVKPPAQPTFGSVQVTDSENVHFGDNIQGDNIVFNFKGPVVIKQVVHPKEQDNPAYEQTEGDTFGSNLRPQKTDTKEEGNMPPPPLNMNLFLKFLFAVVCLVLVGGICAIVYIPMSYDGQESTSNAPGEGQETSSDRKTLVEEYPNYEHMRYVLIKLLLLVIVCVWCARVLTLEQAPKNPNNAPRAAPTRRVRRNQNPAERQSLLIAPYHMRIVPREEWLAQPVERPLERLQLPAPWVIIQHTATENCYTQSECILSVRRIQTFHIESRGWYDIGYNFLIGGDGSAYAGRGWHFEGAHTLGYNRYSIGIAFIGTFNNEAPTKDQLDTCKKLIQKGVLLCKIDPDYKLFAHRQLMSTLSPGDKLFEIMKKWPNFVHNVTNIESLLPGN